MQNVATDQEKFKEFVKLTVDVTANAIRAVDGVYVLLLNANLLAIFAEYIHARLVKKVAVLHSGYPTIRVHGYG